MLPSLKKLLRLAVVTLTIFMLPIREKYGQVAENS